MGVVLITETKYLSDEFPIGSERWLSAKQGEHYQWHKNLVKSTKHPDTLPLNVKLNYALGWLDTEIPE